MVELTSKSYQHLRSREKKFEELQPVPFERLQERLDVPGLWNWRSLHCHPRTTDPLLPALWAYGSLRGLCECSFHNCFTSPLLANHRLPLQAFIQIYHGSRIRLQMAITKSIQCSGRAHGLHLAGWRGAESTNWLVPWRNRRTCIMRVFKVLRFMFRWGQ